MLSRRFVTASVQHRFTARTSRISHSLCRNIYNHCPVSASNRPLQSLHQSPNIASLFRRLFGSLTGPPNPAIMSAAKQKAQGIIAEHPVVVFSKSYCPYCRAAKSLLTEQGATFYAVELDQAEDGSALQDALAELTGQRTVPNIFINHKHIGGNSDLQALKSQLPALLQAAGALKL